MSRSGYSDDGYDEDAWAMIRWRGAVNSAIKGRRGQDFLKEAASLLDAMPVKELIVGELEVSGQFCTLGVVGQARGVDMSKIDTEDREQLSKVFNISEALAAEIMYFNDESIGGGREFAEVEICGPMRTGYPDYGQHRISFRVVDHAAAKRRWQYMRKWIETNIKTSTAEAAK